MSVAGQRVRRWQVHMKKLSWAILPMALAAAFGVAAAFATGGADEPSDGAADNVFLGEQDLAERMEIWRNQFRRMTPGDAPLVQVVGTWPAAWEEFSHAWAVAPAERDLATWLVPVTAERSGSLTVLRDANGTVLWSGATDFAKDESASVTLTGALVSEDDWALWEAARQEIARRVQECREQEVPMRGTNGPCTNGIHFVSASANLTNTPPEFRVGLAWTNSGTLDVFAYGPLHVAETNEVTYTNDENQVIVTNVVSWHSVAPSLSGFDNDWTWVGTLAVTNSETNVFVDTSFTEDRAKVRFYAAAQAVDSDGDGLNDGFELFVSHSSTNSADGDHDGVDDATEHAAGSNPMVSNIWWVTKTTNAWFQQFPLPDCTLNAPATNIWNYPIDGNPPVPGSVVSNVTLSGFVDDAIKVDSNDVDFAQSVQTFTDRCITNEILNLQSKHFSLALWDWPDPTYAGPNEAKIGDSTNNPFRVEWTWMVPMDFRLEHINTNGNPLVVNPVGTRTNREFTCQATVLPTNIPESNIFWSCSSPGMSFVGGVTNGRTVQMKGTQLGDWEATVTVRANTTNTGTLRGTILEQKTVDVYLHIVRDDLGQNAASSVAHFQQLLDGANQIWEQAAISFQLAGNVMFIDNDELLELSMNNDWEELEHLHTNDWHTGGIEVYCVHKFQGGGVLGMNFSPGDERDGLTIATNASALVLAHELGHACGLDDIFIARTVNHVTHALTDEQIDDSYLMADWSEDAPNGGYGDLTVHSLLKRLLMYGIDAESAVDLPANAIWGIMENGTNAFVDVGLANMMTREPEHW